MSPRQLRPPRPPRPEPSVALRRHLATKSSASSAALSTAEAARQDVHGPLPTTRGRSAGPVVEVVSDVGRVLAELVESLPEDSAGELARLVGDSLAAPPSGLLREARLGLLIRLLRERDGELVDTALYEEERERWRLRGVDWPAASTVSRAFGDWLRAQMAAAHLAFRGNRARQPRSHHHTGRRPDYTPDEVLAVMAELRRVFGVWLTHGEYLQFVELRRRAALQLGQPEPRLPTTKPINRLFGGYPAVIAAARIDFGEPAAAPVALTQLAERHNGAGPVSSGRLQPVAGLWWDVVRGTSEADRRLIYQALMRRTHGLRSFRSDVMLSGLARCYDELGGYPSFRRYEQWRATREDPDEWPRGQSIIAIYGSWRKALIHLGAEPTADILVARMRGRAAVFTREEVMTTVDFSAREWRLTHPGQPYRFLDYYQWAGSELERGRNRRFPRLALSRATIERHVGPWAVTLTATGHADLLSPLQLIHEDRRADDELLDYLYGAAEETRLGARISPRAYDGWAAATEAALRAVDPGASVPRYQLFRRRFKVWAVALHRAGLISQAECQRRRYGRGVHMTDDELADVLVQALAELGPDATRALYRAWRERRLTGPSPPAEGIPVDGWLAQRLGNGLWPAAKATALARRYQTE